MTNYRAVAAQAAAKYGLPVQSFLRQINQESGFNPSAHSSAGAQGIAQFMPATAREYGVNPADPISSLYGAAKYDARLLHQYGSFARALSAYNSGKPDAYLDPHFAGGQTYNYVRSILGSSPAAAGGAPATPPVDAAPATAPAAAGIPLAVQAILNANNRTLDLAPVNYGASAPVSPSPGGLRVQVDHSGPVSPNAPGVVKLAEQYLGTPYSWGGGGPGGPSKGTGRGANTVGFDCSSFVQFLYAQKGISVPRTTYEQYKAGRPVSRAALKPGDVVFFEATAQGPGHEGLYIGHGSFVQAPHTGDVVKISKLRDYANVYVGARRLG